MLDGAEQGVFSDSSMLELFTAELKTQCQLLAAGLAAAGPEQVETLSNAANSIAGAARMVGLERLDALASAIEEALGGQPPCADLTRAIRDAGELFQGAGAAAPKDVGKFVAEIDCEITELISRVRAAGTGPVPPDVADLALLSANIADRSMLDLFRQELESRTQVLEKGLIEAEGDPAPECVEPLMRAAHSIKGAARLVGLDLAVELAHAMEDLLSAFQEGRREVAAADIDLLLRANDVFRRLEAQDAAEIPLALERQSAAIHALSGTLSGGLSRSPPRAGNASPAAPTAPPFAAGSAPGAPAGEAPGSAGRERDDAGSAAAPAGGNPGSAGRGDGSVRVLAENLNRMLGLAGEGLVHAKSFTALDASLLRIRKLQAQARRAAESLRQAAHDGLDPELLSGIEEAAQRQEQLEAALAQHAVEFDAFGRRLKLHSERLYGEAVASRMRPFSDGLPGFPRMVRDLARSLGKTVRFEIEGASTRVDRDILERLEAPLTHLLRNAVDHGLETPEARLAEGKSREGLIKLRAHHAGGMLHITVSDDGAGIDPEVLRRRVVEKGHAPADVARKLSATELTDFLFLPGFTTRAAVTEVSGRGVGLDVVQAMVREVGGTIRVDSRPGAGANFRLELPLTLSVLRALLVEIQNEIYAVPLSRIDRVLRLDPGELTSLQDRLFCTVEQENIGLVDARQALGLPVSGNAAGTLQIAVISDRLNRYGLAVDRFLGERDLVVIPFPARLGKIANFSAAAILEDGTPALIFDVDDLVRSIDHLLTAGTLKKSHRDEPAGRPSRKRVLVVDDSLTVRELERRLLENRGYEVSVAVDGVDGWNALQSGDFQLLVTDVDMPRLDGIELVRRLRRASVTAELPVIIVSYKDQEEYRMQGLDAGANYYLTKSSFHDQGLLNAVTDLIGEA